MNNLKIGTRIYIGFGLILLFIVSFSVFSYRNVAVLEDNFNSFERYTDNTEVSFLLDVSYLQLRRRIDAFIVTNNDDPKIAEAFKTLNDYAEDMEKRIIRPENKILIGTVRKEIEEYTKKFADISSKIVEKKTIAYKIIPDSQAITGLLNEVITELEKIDDKAGGEFVSGLFDINVNFTTILIDYRDQSTVRDVKDVRKLYDTYSKMYKDIDKYGNRKIWAAAKEKVGAYLESSGRAIVLFQQVNETETNALNAIAGKTEASLEALRNNFLKITEDSAAASHSLIGGTKTSSVTVALIAVLAAGFVAVVISSGISKPIIAMTKAMLDLAGGNKAIEVPSLKNKDEIGEMAQAVQVFKENAIKVDKMQAEQERMEKEAAEHRRQTMLQTADNFDKSVGGIVAAVVSAAEEMKMTAISMSSIAEQAMQQASTGSAASEESASNVQTVASAAEELASSIAEISRQVAESTNIADVAVRDARETMETMENLSSSAQKIGEVINLIKDVADQTNLLALNATIEAARAGDAGKGFAVVANEVKSLANQTAKATEEISIQVSGVQKVTEDAVQAIGKINDTIQKINNISSAIAAAVEQQGAATQEISKNVQQAAAGSQEVSSNIAGVSQAVTEAGHSAGEVRSASEELAQQGAKLRAEVQNFLHSIRSENA